MREQSKKWWDVVLAAATITGVLALWEWVLFAWLGGDARSSVVVVRHALIDAAIALPLLVGACTVATLVASRLRIGALGTAAVTAVAFFLLLLPTMVLRDLAVRALAASLGNVGEEEARFLCAAGESVRERGLWTSARDALLLQFAVFPGAGLAILLLRVRRLRSGPGAWSPATRRAALGGAIVLLALAVGFVTCPGDNGSVSTSSHTLIVNGCPADAPVRVFRVSAIHVQMTLNRFGNRDSNAYMYVLNDRIDEVRRQERLPLPDRVSVGLRRDPIQPLVLRANLGDCVEIQFTNQLRDGRASIHFLGLAHTAEYAGGAVGRNPDSSAASGQTIVYRIPLPSDPEAERAYYFSDNGDARNRVAHGLFGVLVAEPKGSQHLDPETGQPLTRNDWEAIIAPPDGPAFREFVLVFHEVGDETFQDIEDGVGGKLPRTSPFADIYRPAARAINYRSEAFHNRMQLKDDEALGYGSYAFGDPATPIPRSYLGEPSKTRLVHGGSEMFHVYHLHGGGIRWRMNPRADDPDLSGGLRKVIPEAKSVRLDSQSMGPATTFNLEHECGAGGCQQAAGDFLFHCHIGQHYLAGMWSFWRVFDTRQPDLAVLPGRPEPPVGVNSLGLIGRKVEGKELVPRAKLTDPSSQRALEDWVEAQLPPQGTPLDDEDATVWDWTREERPEGPLYLGEPETTAVWANYRSNAPGQRPEILFNPANGRYAWPLLRPHLGHRPPFAGNGHGGAPWLGREATALRPDGLCPTDEVFPDPLRKTRLYPVTAINIPLPVTRERTDPDGRIFVLGDEKADVRAGLKPAQPLVIRSNVGDCVHMLLTNELTATEKSPSGERPAKVNMHSHFVQFDPQASDGVTTGMSYEQSVKPYPTEKRTLTLATAPGITRIRVSHVDRLRPGIWIGVGLGGGMCANGEKMCTEIRRITAIAGNELELDRPLDLAHAAGEAVGTEFVQEFWYSDADHGAVFFHDHVNFHSWDHGQFAMHIIEPRGATYHDPKTGQEIRSGPIADIHAPPSSSPYPDISGDFREFAVFVHENNPAAAGTINLRAEPFSRRSDPFLRFSSVRYGDPWTLLPRAYVGDPFVVRGIGVTNSTASIRFTGHRFASLDTSAREYQRTDSMAVGISERFGFPLEGGAGGPEHLAGDYLYYSTLGRDFVAGAWGLLRVHDTAQPDLQPLPGRTPPSGSGFPRLSTTEGAPPAAQDPGHPCPSGAAVRAYSVKALRANVIYQDNPEWKDSNGVVFVPDDGRPTSGRPDVRTPLVLRVNQGECLEITVANAFDQPVGLHVGELLFDPQGSYGAPIGFNPDSSVPPGGRRLFRFFADAPVGTTVALNLANPELGARGAYAAVIVEPAGATYRDPFSGAAGGTGVLADILTPTHSFREMVALFQDEDPRIGSFTMPYPRDVAGFTGLNYSAARLEHRQKSSPQYAFSSSLNGDPRVMAFAHAGDPFVFRVAQPWGEQQHVFAPDGHRFYTDAMQHAEQIYSRQILPGGAFEAELMGGAGGDPLNAPGDYLFGDRRWPFLQAGLWGILRVLPPGDPTILPLQSAPLDAGIEKDAGVPLDAGVVDAGVRLDAGVVDAGVHLDAGVAVDAGVPVDAGIRLDGGVPSDAGISTPDAGLADAGTPGGGGDGGIPVPGPTIRIIQPAQGAWIPRFKSVDLIAEASDPRGIAHVEFFVDGTQIVRDRTAPYRATWYPTYGPHQLSAVATNQAGQSASSTVSVCVPQKNGFGCTDPSDAPPGVRILNPRDGAILNAGTIVDLSADATDDREVTRVDLSADGELLRSDHAPRYHAYWEASPGNHELTATAIDSGGQRTTARVNVCVRSRRGGGCGFAHQDLPPTLVITSPVQDQRFAAGDEIHFHADVTDDHGIRDVQFFLDGKLLETDRAPSYHTFFPAPSGHHELKAVVTDKSGQSVEETVRIRVQ